jgi:tricorn protease-like protein
MRLLAVLFAAAGLAACSTTVSQVVDTSERVWIGAFLPMQDPISDQVVFDSGPEMKGTDYFLPMWEEYKKGAVKGVVEDAVIFLKHGGERVFEKKIHVDGHKYVSVPLHLIQPNTAVCIELPWENVAHRKKRVLEDIRGDKTSIVCTPDVYPYLKRDGRGRHAGDAYGVIAIKPAEGLS